MGRRRKDGDQVAAKPEDVDFANNLLKQGLIPGGAAKRALAVLLYQEAESEEERPSTAVRAVKSASPTEPPQEDTTTPSAKGMLPRSWKQAEKFAAQNKKPARPRTAGVAPASAQAPPQPVTEEPTKTKTRRGIFAPAPKRVRSPKRKMSMVELEEAERQRLHGVRRVSVPRAPAASTGTGTGTPLSSEAIPERHYASSKVQRACEDRVSAIGRRLLDLLADAAQDGGEDQAYLRLVLNEAGAKESAAAIPGRAHLSHVGSDFTREVANYCACATEETSPSVSLAAPGVSLLHMCTVWNLNAFAELLLSRGALVNRVNEDLETPLHWAAASNAYQTAALLLDFGADMTAEDASGSCALTRAAHSGHLEIVSLLLARARGSISVLKLQEVLKIARAAVEAAAQEGADAGGGKQAVLVLVQRHLQIMRGNAPVPSPSSMAEPAAMGKSGALLRLTTPTVGKRPQSSVAAAGAQSQESQTGTEVQAGLYDVPQLADFDEPPDAAVLEAEIARLAAQCVELKTLSDSAGAAESALVFAPRAENFAVAIAEPSLAVTGPARGRSGERKNSAPAATKVPDMPLAAVSPRRARVVPKFYPAGYVPFLHDRPLDSLGGVHANGLTCEPGDVLVAVEQCAHCETHNFSLWHDAAKYNSIADRCMIALVRALLDKGFRVRLFALKEVPRASRTGALEVTCSVRVGQGPEGRWMTTTLHSKLDSSSWPAVKRVATRGAAFVQWALEEGGIHSCLGGSSAQPAGLPLQRAILAEQEREVDAAAPPSGAATVPLVGPGSAMKKLQVEGQFMSWLIRLSMSSANSPVPQQGKGGRGRAAGSATNAIPKPSWDPMSTGDAAQSIDEWTRGNIQSFGAFYNPFARHGTFARMSEVGVAAAMSTTAGSGAVAGRSVKRNTATAVLVVDTPFGTVLEPEPFEKLVLQHFFVFDNLSPAELSPPPSPPAPPARHQHSPEREAAEDFVHRTLLVAFPARARSPSPERIVAEAFVLRTLQALTLPAKVPAVNADVEKLSSERVFKAAKGSAKSHPVSPPKNSTEEPHSQAGVLDAVAAAGSPERGKGAAAKQSSTFPPNRGEPAPVSAKPKITFSASAAGVVALDSVVSAGTLTTPGKVEVESEVDPSYDDDTYEEEGYEAGLAVAAECVDAEAAKSFQGRTRDACGAVEEAEEEMVEYSAEALAELALITNVLSPASPLAAARHQEPDADSLVFSMSADSTYPGEGD